MISPNPKKKINPLTDDEIEYGEKPFGIQIGIRCDVNESLNAPTFEGDFVMTNYKIVFKRKKEA